MLPVRFRKLDIASSSLLSPPPSAAVTALQSPLPRERQKEDRRLDRTRARGKLLSYLFNFRPRGNNIHCVREPRHDTVPTDIAPNHRETYLFTPPVKPYSSLFISTERKIYSLIAIYSRVNIDLSFIITSSVITRIDSPIYKPFSFHPNIVYTGREETWEGGKVRLSNSVMQFLSKKLKR